MAKRRILTFKDSSLHRVCRPVERFDGRLWTMLDDMAETMYEAQGAGFAAPQIGVLRRAFIINCGEGLIEMINPEILETSGEQGGMEGCLSSPGQSGYVVRPNFVKVRAFDRHGIEREYKGEGLFARAVLHENDHLDGLIYTRLITEPPEGYMEEEQE